MQELISITTNAQGASVVSARELHGFLESKRHFSEWIKDRIIKYGFLEGIDYVEVEAVSKNLETDNEGVFHKTVKNSKGGRTATDYALTLDTAKELSMVERNEKGKAARQYFIQAEKSLRAITAAPAQLNTEQVLLQLVQQSNQLLAGQQEQLSQLRADVDHILTTSHRPPAGPPRQVGKQLMLPGTTPPLHRSRSGRASLRQLINHKVNDYCAYHGAEPGETYNYLYKRLFEVYSVNVYRLQQAVGESLLDTLERYGHLERLYSLVREELHYADE